MIANPLSEELTEPDGRLGRKPPASVMDCIRDVDPLDLLVSRKRGPQKAEDKKRRPIRKMVNYRWTQATRTALRREADRLGVSSSALAEVIVLMTLKNDPARRLLQDMVELGH